MIWVLAVLVAFVPVWALVCWVLSSLSGWGRLAERYRAGSRARAQRKLTGGRVGGVAYSGCLYVSGDAHGLSVSVLLLFRVAHPPLFIPWTKLAVSAGEYMNQRTLVFKVLDVQDAAIELPHAIGLSLHETAGIDDPRPANHRSGNGP
jgi:hypothetical protein